MLDDDVADGVDIERPAKRLSEGDEALHFLGPHLRGDGARLSGCRVRFGLLPLALLLKQEHDDEDQQRGNQAEARRALDLAR